MASYTTAIRRYETSPGSLRDLVKDCGGLEGLRRGGPGLHQAQPGGPGTIAFPMPYYGVLTTTRLVHDMVILLKEHGITSHHHR